MRFFDKIRTLAMVFGRKTTLMRLSGVFDVYELDPLIARAQKGKPLVGDKLTWALSQGLARRRVHQHNLVVTQGANIIASVMGGGRGAPFAGMTPLNVVDFTVAEMQITAQVAPAAPAAGDVALVGVPVWTGHRDPAGGGDSLLTMTYPGAGQVMYSTTIPNAFLNGTALTEEGLFDDNGNLVARVTFTKTKLGTFALQLDHTLTFTPV